MFLQFQLSGLEVEGTVQVQIRGRVHIFFQMRIKTRVLLWGRAIILSPYDRREDASPRIAGRHCEPDRSSVNRPLFRVGQGGALGGVRFAQDEQRDR